MTLPLATLNCAVAVAPRCLPLALSTPPLPPGTVIVSDEDGTNGAMATKVKVVGVASSQVPPTFGLRVGVGELVLSESEKRTSIDVSLGTWAAPATGVMDWMANAPDPPPLGLEVGEAAARPPDPRRKVLPTATPPTTTTRTERTRTKVRRRWPDPLDFVAECAPGIARLSESACSVEPTSSSEHSLVSCIEWSGEFPSALRRREAQGRGLRGRPPQPPFVEAIRAATVRSRALISAESVSLAPSAHRM